ncbi:helix-turn-helix transcriptional regulator [Fulvivirga sp.]|uniref:helix-turn-helix domain-containing protein n=1 Tax=Fulvivirga sp. TaxID=1931237 RepID=UPI0032EF2C9F
MASKINSDKLSSMIKSKRGKQGLRATAKEINISAPTLSRIEQGKLPDIDTYVKICEWLNVSTDYFTESTVNQEDTQTNVIASLRADKTLSAETVESLVNFINLAFNQVKNKNS